MKLYFIYSADKVSDISSAVGYSSQSKFGTAFKKHFDVSSLEYRRFNKLKEEKDK